MSGQGPLDCNSPWMMPLWCSCAPVSSPPTSGAASADWDAKLLSICAAVNDSALSYPRCLVSAVDGALAEAEFEGAIYAAASAAFGEAARAASSAAVSLEADLTWPAFGSADVADRDVTSSDSLSATAASVTPAVLADAAVTDCLEILKSAVLPAGFAAPGACSASSGAAAAAVVGGVVEEQPCALLLCFSLSQADRKVHL